MALSSIGDLARSYGLRNQTTVLKAELDRRSAESTTGKVSDAGRLLRGDFTQLTAIDVSLSRLDAFGSATTEATLTANGLQSALGTLSDLSTDLARSLLSVASPGNAVSVNSVGQDAMVRFRSAVATMNTRIGDRTLFAGIETRQPALASPDVILDALVTAAAAATTAADIETAVSAWFAAPAGYAGVAYLGGAPTDPQAIAQGEAISLGVTAADPALRDTLKGLAMAALLDRGVLAGDTVERAALARGAGESLLETASARTELAARVGTAEERIGTASTRNSAEATALRIARLGIVAVDDYASATALTQAEAQLDKLYAITARLSRLSLVGRL